MFSLTISKQQLLPALLNVAGAVDKKQSLPILSHILLRLSDQQLSLTATDLEVEITACIPLTATVEHFGSITVPARKFIDIIKSLDDNANPIITNDAGVVTITGGGSKFKLATLSADSFPNSSDEVNDIELNINRLAFIHLLQSTHFAISQQDVRIFLNGLFLEFNPKLLTAVASDGHRMAICRMATNYNGDHYRLLPPRKGVLEILHLLNTITDEEVMLSAGKNHFKISTKQYQFTTKLLDTRFPPYTKVIPKEHNKHVIIDRDVLKRALSRIIILAHEKSRAVVLHLQANQLTLVANNQEQEEATEILAAEIDGEELSIGFNASYLLDVLNYIAAGPLRLSMYATDSSILVESLADDNYSYIIMPMKI